MLVVEPDLLDSKMLLFKFEGHWGKFQYSIFVWYCKALRTMLLKGEGNVTPWFWPHGIEIVNNLYIVCKSWQWAQVQCPTIDLLVCVSLIKVDVTPWFWPQLHWIVNDVNNVIKSWCGAQGKGPAIDLTFMYWRLKSMPMVYVLARHNVFEMPCKMLH